MKTPHGIVVLVVDDNETGRYLKARTLRRCGYRVMEAATGVETLRLVESQAIDLVVLDVKLPDMNGIEVCRRIKASYADVVVLQTSATFTEPHHKAKALRGGADVYLVEPIESEELVAAAASLLRLRDAERDLHRLQETMERRVAERTRQMSETHQRLLAASEQRAKEEEALRHSQKLDAVGRLTGGIAHDFNNHLMVILASFELIEKKMRQQPQPMEDIDRLITSGRGATLECEYLTRQLLAFAHRDPLRFDVVDVNAAITRVEMRINGTMGPQTDVTLSLAEDLWPVRLDPSQFEASLLNLAANAHDAMPDGGSLRISSANLRLSRGGESSGPFSPPADAVAGEYVVVCVADSGGGMTDDVLAHAFDPFFTTKDVGKGSGLGLSQVYGFVKQCDGFVSVETHPDQGTRFCMFLPRAVGAMATSAERPPAYAEGDIPNGDETILVVDDNELVLDTVVELISDLGYHVKQATDGNSALEILKDEEPVQLLFTDVVMPNGMSGIELAREAKRRWPDLKVLMTSGYSVRGATEEQPMAGFHSIAKPYRPEDLAKRLREALEQ